MIVSIYEYDTGVELELWCHDSNIRAPRRCATGMFKIEDTSAFLAIFRIKEHLLNFNVVFIPVIFHWKTVEYSLLNLCFSSDWSWAKLSKILDQNFPDILGKNVTIAAYFAILESSTFYQLENDESEIQSF